MGGHCLSLRGGISVVLRCLAGLLANQQGAIVNDRLPNVEVLPGIEVLPGHFVLAVVISLA